MTIKIEEVFLEISLESEHQIPDETDKWERCDHIIGSR